MNDAQVIKLIALLVGGIPGAMIAWNLYQKQVKRTADRRFAMHMNGDPQEDVDISKYGVKYSTASKQFVEPFVNYEPALWGAGGLLLLFGLLAFASSSIWGMLTASVLMFFTSPITLALVVAHHLEEQEQERITTTRKEPQPEFADTNIEVHVEPPPPLLDKHRLSHMLILGGSGSGKTSFLKQIIATDLHNPTTLIVFDSQGDLLNSVLKVDVPRERIVLIDPTDVRHPIALSLFDFKSKAETDYDKEKNFNSVVELLMFVLQSLDSQVTPKQELALRMLIRLCLVIPNATIHTLRDLLTDAGYKQHAQYVSRLGPTAQSFFNEYTGKAYQETREQIARRVYSILEIQTLERMFSSPTSKLDMGELMDNGSIILINTAKSFLKEQGSAFFSRFMIATIFQAIQERNPRAQNTPVYMLIDEAAPIISPQTSNILETGRKYSLGCTLAFQSLGQIPAELQHSVIANTAIKAVSGISAKDARALADDMRTKPENLMGVRRLSFYVYTPDREEVVPVELGVLDAMPRRKDLSDLYRENRERFSHDLKATPQPSQDVSQSDIE